MKRQCKIIFSVVIASNLLLTLQAYAQEFDIDEIGRLFTTVQERKLLDQVRHAEPVKVEVVDIVVEDIIEEEKEVVQPEIGGIKINGLVYRKDGKSTAWINSGNTYEGNLNNQYLYIDSEGIDSDSVNIQLPANMMDIKLRVGQTYDAKTEKVVDLTDTYSE